MHLVNHKIIRLRMAFAEGGNNSYN